MSDASDLPAGSHDMPISAKAAHRILALDFTKGLLVLIMVFYHWLNYFVSTSGFFYRYMRFLTPSFIFITGYLISHVYFGKYDINTVTLPRRLSERGLKLVVLFLVLNAVVSVLLPGSTSKTVHDWSLGNLVSVYLTGTTTAAFSILVPIGYLLVLSASLLILSRYYQHTFHAACLLSILCIQVLGVNGIQNAYLELVSIGLIGISLGFVPVHRVNSLVKHPYILLLAFICYLGAITIWNEVYPLQVAGVCVTLAIMYAFGMVSEGWGKIPEFVILLGRYSLFGYIAQIAVLQTLRSCLKQFSPGNGLLVVSFFAGVALTLLGVLLVDRARARSVVANRLYSVVFS